MGNKVSKGTETQGEAEDNPVIMSLMIAPKWTEDRNT
jgi:hypothetical protein